MKRDVLVIGGINTDYVGRAGALPRPGETRHGDKFREGPGGKGANQAVAAARLGASVALISAVGADVRGRASIEHLRRIGVDSGGVVAVPKHTTGAALILIDRRGEKQTLYVPGANRALEVRHVERSCATIAHARVVLAQLEVPLACVALAFDWGRAARAVTILDPAPAQRLSDEFLRKVDVIRPNRHEAEVLTGVHVDDRASAREAASRLIARGPGIAIVEAGHQGNLLVTRDRECWWPRHDVVSVDSTGAGDAFAGTLAACLARGRSVVEAATFANAAAAIATTEFGAQCPPVTETDLQDFLNARGPGVSAQAE
jgi:ribokinase